MDKIDKNKDKDEAAQASEGSGEAENTQSAADGEEYPELSKPKAALLKCLPLMIVLVCTGLFMWGIKAVIGVFYAPHDEVFVKESGAEKYVVVKCFQNPSSYFYVYDGDFVFNEAEYDNVAGEHNDAHLLKVPEVYFVLNETAPDMETVTVKLLSEGNGLKVFQFGEFILYRLEGQYGVFAPLRDYTESATSRKNDLYVVRQLMKNDAYLKFEMPYEREETFFELLEKLEWHLDTEYIEDN